jgi:hypothetical protein
MECESWDDLHQLGDHNTSESLTVTDIVIQGLASVQPEHGLSDEAISFLCSYNNIRRDGNYSAHSANEGEIKDAIQTKPICSQERNFLEQLYNFVFNISI